MGYVVGTIFLAKYGDIIGRIKVLRVGLAFSLMIYGIVIFISRNAILTYMLLFFFGVFANIRVNLGFIYG